MPELIAPTVRLHGAWLEAHAEWGQGPHEDGFGLCPSDEVHSPEGFAAWVLAVCAVDNAASVGTIERCGGIFEGVRDGLRRYWNRLPQA
jgi:hypothetical protein